MNRDGLLDAFATFPDRLAAAIVTADAPADGEWGPPEVVRHLIAVESEVWRARLATVADEDDPHWSWTEPGLEPGFEGARLADILKAFAEARAGTVEIVCALDDPGWARSGVHATYGRLDVMGLLRIAVDHDAEHLAGIARS